MADYQLDGKVVLVTGGARGMGRAIALAFANEGATVVITDIDDDGARATVSEIEAAGGQGRFIRADVSVPAEVEALVAGAVEAYGSIDCACNNAGIELEAGPLADIGDDVFDRLVAVNLKGVFLCMKHQIKQMQRQAGGTIVNIGSINSLRPQPTGAVYTSTKAALVGLSRSAANIYAAEGIRINMVLPGAIDTPMLAQKMRDVGLTESDIVDDLSLIGRFGRPEEVAEAVLWLSSPKSSYTFGHLLAVDGGYLAR
jgi:NAD(P)-dependent dehydrogenase (short-subunit alcohol dehydrogenase family)